MRSPQNIEQCSHSNFVLQLKMEKKSILIDDHLPTVRISSIFFSVKAALSKALLSGAMPFRSWSRLIRSVTCATDSSPEAWAMLGAASRTPRAVRRKPVLVRTVTVIGLWFSLITRRKIRWITYFSKSSEMKKKVTRRSNFSFRLMSLIASRRSVW